MDKETSMIIKEFYRRFPDKTVLYVKDPKDESYYIVNAVPSSKSKKTILDSLFVVDKKTYKILRVFQPIQNINAYKNARTIYEKDGVKNVRK